MVILGLALVSYAVFEAVSTFDSNRAENQAALPPTLLPLETQAAPTTQAAVVVPSASPGTALPPAEESSPIASEHPTVPPIATLPAAPVAKPSGTTARAVRIVIPVLHLDARVVNMPDIVVMQNGQRVSNWDVPKYDVGHAAGSANPGERDNVVLSAHNNLYNALFRKLYTMKPGDEITLFNAAGNSFLYRVVQSYIVQEVGVSFEQQVANARVMLPTKDARLTLISCYPENNNTHRAIVIALLIDLG